MRWVGGMLQGDFGTSYTYRAPVAELVTARLAVSLPLAVMALLLSTLIAIPVGLYAASRRGGPGDWSVMGLTQLGIAIPNFWFAMILVVIFAIKLRWFSAGGFPGLGRGHLAEPEGADPAGGGAGPAASLDPGAGDALGSARGAGPGLYPHGAGQGAEPAAHADRPCASQRADPGADHHRAAILISSSPARSSSRMCSSSPGSGRLVFQGITQRDLIVVESVVMLLVFAAILVNFIVDIAYGFADPRLRRR